MQAQHAQSIRKSHLIDASPVYYGWVILVVSAIGSIMTGPGQTYAVSVFIDYFISDLDISRGLISSLYTAATLAACLALPTVGRQIDRRGARWMMVVVSFSFGLTCIYMGFVRSALMLLLGFVALRMLGPGSLSLVSANAINQWWVRRRGMAMGIAGMVTALLSGGGFPNLINGLIPAYGWRASYMFLGGMIWLLVLPLGWIFVRDRPEAYGLQPDGLALPLEPGEEGSAAPLEENWTLSEAVRTATFWLIAAGIAAIWALSTGLNFHIFSIFRDSGLSGKVAATVFVPIAATSAIIQLAGGFLMGRIPVRVMLAASLLLQAVNLILAPSLSSVAMAYLYGLIAGISDGLTFIVHNVVWAKYYGRQHLGSITGVVATVLVGSSALGPMPFGIARDLMGSYRPVLVTLAVLPFVLAWCILFFAKPPARR